MAFSNSVSDTWPANKQTKKRSKASSMADQTKSGGMCASTTQHSSSILNVMEYRSIPPQHCLHTIRTALLHVKLSEQLLQSFSVFIQELRSNLLIYFLWRRLRIWVRKKSNNHIADDAARHLPVFWSLLSLVTALFRGIVMVVGSLLLQGEKKLKSIPRSTRTEWSQTTCEVSHNIIDMGNAAIQWWWMTYQSRVADETNLGEARGLPDLSSLIVFCTSVIPNPNARPEPRTAKEQRSI